MVASSKKSLFPAGFGFAANVTLPTLLAQTGAAEGLTDGVRQMFICGR